MRLSIRPSVGPANERLIAYYVVLTLNSEHLLSEVEDTGLTLITKSLRAFSTRERGGGGVYASRLMTEAQLGLARVAVRNSKLSHKQR